ncbi:MAG: peroxiredoxin [Alphaproteobacteria bacterium]|nr:peroxiredoxin [Alphaproteobacteria bacterium]
MPIQVGQRMPSVTLRVMTDAGVKEVATGDLFKGKKVALFGVPGAFTPTCSAKHLPSYIDNSAKLKEKGVDAIACVSVNDAFVMGAWGKAQNAGDKVMMLADGNGELAKQLGIELDASKNGLGMRNKRFSMLVEDGVVKQLNLEAAGEYKISDAETLLKQI